MLELMIALTLLLSALLGYSQVIVTTAASAVSVREEDLATQAVRSMVQTLKSASFVEAFSLFNATPADDPGGLGTAPSANFAVPGLHVAPGDPDIFPGEILFPTTANAPGVLREDLPDPNFATPCDLNGDGVIDSANHATNYVLLPVVVRVRWTGAAGVCTVEAKTLVAQLP